MDATGDVLRGLRADGSDLSKPMKVEFHVAVPSKATAQLVAADARGLGFEVDVYGDDEEGWTVTCSRMMLATHAGIVETEHQLDQLAQPHGGQADGWGTFGNAGE